MSIKHPLREAARRGFRGYPIATVAFYGADDTVATKAAVGIVFREGGDVEAMGRWHSEEGDLRKSLPVAQEILAFIREHTVRSVVLSPGIIGCPHEEGVDYPEGDACSQCPFWADRDRWTGQPRP
ncbi:MAG: hypothetical protein HY359_02120 [Candidatus Rokubacteria bacterium]|nr:hypothetical protein [Candidatus Rokubacteria bacterium]